MNKNKIKILIVILISLFLPGCAKYSIQMDIGKDKSVMLEFITAVEEEYEEESYIESDREAAERKGFKSEYYYKDSYIGYRLTKRYTNIDLISSNIPVTVELRDILNSNKSEPNYYFQKEKGFFSTKYIASFTVDTFDSESTYLTSVDFEVNLPSKAKTSNATTTSSDGKTLKWDLEAGTKNKINFEFEIRSKAAPIFAGIVVGLFIIIILYLKLTGKPKNNNIYNYQNNYPNNNFNNQNNINNQQVNTNQPIGNIDAEDVSMYENYINNMLPQQNMNYSNNIINTTPVYQNNNVFNGSIDPDTSLNYMNDMSQMQSQYYKNINENNLYSTNITSLYQNENMYPNENMNTYDNKNNNIEDDIDKPNLNTNNVNITPEEKRYELSSNKDIYK